jgi:hypothetical protein
MSKQLQLAILSYGGDEHRDYLQSHINGITLALETLPSDLFHVEHHSVLPRQNVVDSVLNSLEKSGVLAVVGPFDSETAALVVPTATKLGLPVLSTGATSPLLNGGDLSKTTFFRLGGSDREIIKDLAEWLSAEHARATVMVVAEKKTPSACYGDEQFIALQSTGLSMGLVMLPVRYERGRIGEVFDRCLRDIRQQHRGISAVVALGYSNDTIQLCQLFSKHDIDIPVYTTNPKKTLFERSGLDNVRAVVSHFEYANMPKWESFRKQYLARFSDQPHVTYHGSATCAFDLIHILYERTIEGGVCGAPRIREARQKLIAELLTSHRIVEDALTSGGIFTSNHELAFQTRHVTLRGGEFVEFDGNVAPRWRRRVRRAIKRIRHMHNRAVERFGFVKHGYDMWKLIIAVVLAVLLFVAYFTGHGTWEKIIDRVRNLFKEFSGN